MDRYPEKAFASSFAESLVSQDKFYSNSHFTDKEIEGKAGQVVFSVVNKQKVTEAVCSNDCTEFLMKIKILLVKLIEKKRQKVKRFPFGAIILNTL